MPDEQSRLLGVLALGHVNGWLCLRTVSEDCVCHGALRAGRVVSGAVSVNDEPLGASAVLVDAEDLLDLDPARAELWVSGLLADFDDAEVDTLLGSIADASDAQNVVGRLVAAVISVVAEPAMAERAKQVCSPEEVSAPSWASALGSAAPVDAMAVEVDGLRSSVIVRFEHANGDRHLMLVELDPDDGIVTDLRFAPDGLFDDELDDDAIELIPQPLESLGAMLAAALGPADRNTPSVALNRLVARRRIEALGADLSPGAQPDADLAKSALLGESAISGSSSDAATGEIDSDRDEGDSAAVELLESALAKSFAASGPTDQVFEQLAARLQPEPDSPESGNEADVEAVRGTAGLTGSEPPREFVLRFVSAYAVPRRLDLFTPEEQDAIRHLEWADWLGVIIGLVRGGEGAAVTPHGMVKAINRCPEITTTIPKADADYVAWSFELTLHAWSLAGVVDDEEKLTAFGADVLPRAFRAAWAR